jgi:hypothetical protein
VIEILSVNLDMGQRHRVLNGLRVEFLLHVAVLLLPKVDILEFLIGKPLASRSSCWLLIWVQYGWRGGLMAAG